MPGENRRELERLRLPAVLLVQPLGPLLSASIDTLMNKSSWAWVSERRKSKLTTRPGATSSRNARATAFSVKRTLRP